ncbi:MAG TPA: aminoglycoside phosphotransferase family protein [Caulobacteraceae bacterium]|nr:aminoglycoside phosphotransferase family protein [Caulobacteraceae bacterium]
MIQPPARQAEPAADVDVTVDLARALLRDQHSDLAELPITPAETGWDNAMLRLGGDLALRLPRRSVAAWLAMNEQTWLPRVAAGLPLPAPIPVRIGKPALGYPYPWSVVPWFEGAPSDLAPPGPDQGEPLAAFLRALHQPAPDEAPHNRVRGVPLAERAEAFEDRFVQAEHRHGRLAPHLRQTWDAALAAPIDLPRTWFHGDLHGRNAIVQGGRFAAIIDWGDMAGGDPACDLAAVWMLLPDYAARRAAIDAYGASEATWTRARGWAALMAVMLLPIADNPRMPAMAARIVERLAEGP